MFKSCHFCVPWDADILDPDDFKPSFVSQAGNKHTLTCKGRNTEFGDRTISMPEWCPISLSVSQSLFRSCLWIIHVSSARNFISVAKDLPFCSHSSAQISRMLQKSQFSRRRLRLHLLDVMHVRTLSHQVVDCYLRVAANFPWRRRHP